MGVAHCASLSSTTLLYYAKTPNQMLWSAVPLMAAHGWQAAQQVATVNSTAETRTAALGRLGLSYGAGFLTGTVVISKLVPSLSSHEMIIMAGAVEVGSLAFLVFYPAPTANVSQSTEQQDGSSNTFSTTIEVLRKPHVAPLLVFKAAMCTAANMVLSMVAQYSVDLFHLPASSAAILMASVGGFQLLSSAVVAPRIGIQSPQTIRAIATLGVGTSLAGLSMCHVNVQSFSAALAPLALVFHASVVAIDSTLTVLVEPEYAGTLFGVNGVTWAIAGMLAPNMSAHLFKLYGFSFVPAVGLTIVSIAGISTALWDIAATRQEADAELEDELQGELHI